MKRSGFTLIELLAVIVILAIIALITVPVVLNAIGTAREGAARESVNGYISAAEHARATDLLKNQTLGTTTVDYKGNAVTASNTTWDATGTVMQSGTFTTGTYTFYLCSANAQVQKTACA